MPLVTGSSCLSLYRNRSVDSGTLMEFCGYHILVPRGHLLPPSHNLRDALFGVMVKGHFFPVKDAPVKCLDLGSGQVTSQRRVQRVYKLLWTAPIVLMLP